MANQVKVKLGVDYAALTAWLVWAAVFFGLGYIVAG